MLVPISQNMWKLFKSLPQNSLIESWKFVQQFIGIFVGTRWVANLLLCVNYHPQNSTHAHPFSVSTYCNSTCSIITKTLRCNNLTNPYKIRKAIANRKISERWEKENYEHFLFWFRLPILCLLGIVSIMQIHLHALSLYVTTIQALFWKGGGKNSLFQ